MIRNKNKHTWGSTLTIRGESVKKGLKDFEEFIAHVREFMKRSGKWKMNKTVNMEFKYRRLPEDHKLKLLEKLKDFWKQLCCRNCAKVQKRLKPNGEIHHWRNAADREVNFIIREGWK